MKQAFAIIRADDFQSPDVELRNRIKVKKIVWSQAEAEAEVARLQNGAADGCTYFWQTTKVQAGEPSQTSSSN